MLAWTPATDDVAVSAYVMTQNGQIIGEAAQPQFAVIARLLDGLHLYREGA